IFSFCLPVVLADLAFATTSPLSLSLSLSFHLYLLSSWTGPSPLHLSLSVVISPSWLPANFLLPEPSDFLEEVVFVELQREEASKLVKEYNEEGRKAGPPPDKRYDNRPGGFRGNGGGYQRYDDRGGPRGGVGYQSRDAGAGGYRRGKEGADSSPGNNHGGYNGNRWGGNGNYREGGSAPRGGYNRNQQSGGYNRPAPYSKGGYNQSYTPSSYNQGNYQQGYNYGSYSQYPGCSQTQSYSETTPAAAGQTYSQQQNYNQQYQQVVTIATSSTSG
uniref:Uncharacterized protein n=1 Tax=Hucho hucho TaxID=62062 RepID=A0A4W5KN54_9TELE